MDHLKVGDIILLKPEVHDVVGQMVATATESEFCHAVMVYNAHPNDLKVIGLVRDGVHINRMDASIVEEGAYYNGYVMRHREKMHHTDYDRLKRTANKMLHKGIGFDYNGLFILREFHEVHKKIRLGEGGAASAEYFLLVAAEFLNMTSRVNSTGPGRHKIKEKMHCAQFIYNLFYESGEKLRLDINGGVFLSDFEVDWKNKSESAENEMIDKVDYLTKLLRERLFQKPKQESEGEHHLDKYEPLRLSPVMNRRQYVAAEGDFDRLMMPEDLHTRVAAALVATCDFAKYTANLQHVGNIDATIKQKRHSHGRSDSF